MRETVPSHEYLMNNSRTHSLEQQLSHDGGKNLKKTLRNRFLTSFLVNCLQPDSLRHV